MDGTKWKDAVRVVRGAALQDAMRAGNGRATAFDFTGEGGTKTWIGTVTMKPGACTGGHHHGRHEAMIYVVRGSVEISWGDALEHSCVVGPGDFIYFTPNVPHQERNLSAADTAEFVVVRSDNERIVVALDGLSNHA